MILECCALLRFFGVRARIVDFHLENYENKRKFDQTSGDDSNASQKGSVSMSAADSQIQSHIGLWLKQYFQNDMCSPNNNNSSSGSSSSSSGVSQFFSSTSTTTAGSTVSESTKNKFLPPLYFQHDGHSRTIVGMYADGVDCLINYIS